MNALNPYHLLMDFAIMSILLFVAQFLRARVKLIQNFLLPSSLLAGFMGLFLGPQFLNILPFTTSTSSYSYLLVVFLFASLFIGSESEGNFKQMMAEVGDTFLVNGAVYFLQYAFALLLGGGILYFLYPQIPQAFSLLMPGGFIGGHGAAAAFGGAFKELIGWDEALPIAQTFATIGLVAGIIGGIIYINIATRLKWTRFIKTMAELPEGMRTGMNPEEEREIMGYNTVNTMSIDPITWHVALILIATCMGYYLTNYLQGMFPSLSIPMFSVAMLCGVVLQFILKILKVNNYVDKRIITRIGSSATDYLVAFGVATIKISVVIKYLVPILILSAIGLTFAVLYVYIVARKLFHNFWFERGIFIFGWSTGVVAIGVTLLRIVDPEYKSKALEEYGMAYVFLSFIEIGLLAFLPTLVVTGFSFISGVVLLVVGLAFLGACMKVYGVSKYKNDEIRDTEKAILSKG